MAYYVLERWIKIEVMASSCHDYAVCSNSLQFRLWLWIFYCPQHHCTRRFAQVASRSQLHYIVIAARSSICSGSSCSRQPQEHEAVVQLGQCACSARSSSWCHLCSAGSSSIGRPCTPLHATFYLIGLLGRVRLMSVLHDGRIAFGGRAFLHLHTRAGHPGKQHRQRRGMFPPEYVHKAPHDPVSLKR